MNCNLLLAGIDLLAKYWKKWCCESISPFSSIKSITCWKFPADVLQKAVAAKISAAKEMDLMVSFIFFWKLWWVLATTWPTHFIARHTEAWDGYIWKRADRKEVIHTRYKPLYSYCADHNSNIIISQSVKFLVLHFLFVCNILPAWF